MIYEVDEAQRTITFLGMTITMEAAAAAHSAGVNPWANHPLAREIDGQKRS